MMTRATAVYLAAGVTAMLTAVMMVDRMVVPFSPFEWTHLAPSTGFVVLAEAAGGLESRYGGCMLAGLVGCWFGDYFGSVHFVASVLAFLAGHVAFSLGYVTRGVRRDKAALAGGVMAVTGVLLMWWLLPHVEGAMAALVLSYLVAISVMVTLSAGAFRGNGWILSGALLFYVSDIFVARWRFVSPSSLNAWFCYPLYYTACIFLALSIWWDGSRSTTAVGPGENLSSVEPSN